MSDQEDDSDEQHEHDPDLIPPFVPDQKVFTAKLEEPNDKNGSDEKPEPHFEAVIRQVRHHPNEPPGTDKSWTFLIHYKGWNARYDRWMTASQLVADTPETRQIFEQQQAKEQAKLEAHKKETLRKKEQAVAAKGQAKDQAKAASKASNTNSDNIDIDDVEPVDLPFSLRIVMVDERAMVARLGWDDPWGYDESDMQNAAKMIKRGEQPKSIIAREPARSVHTLPAEVTIRQFLKHFEKSIRKEWKQKQEAKYNKAVASAAAAAKGGDKKDSSGENTQMYKDQLKQKFLEANNKHKEEVRQFRLGIGQLFEVALPKCLLYKQERPQYNYYIQNGNTEQSRDNNGGGEGDNKESTSAATSALDVYGCEFLLRLILRLPYMMRPLPPLLTDMIVHLQRNKPDFFKAKWRPPKFPEEWAEWEQRFYGGPTDATSSSDKNQQGEDSKPAASATAKKGADKKGTTPSSSHKRQAKELGTTPSSGNKKQPAEDSKPAATATAKETADNKGTTPSSSKKRQAEEFNSAASDTAKKRAADKETTPTSSKKRQLEESEAAAAARAKKKADKKAKKMSDKNIKNGSDAG